MDFLDFLSSPAPTWLVIAGLALVLFQIGRMWEGLGRVALATLKRLGVDV